MTWRIQHLPASRTKSLPEAVITDADGIRVVTLHGSQIRHAPLILAAHDLKDSAWLALEELTQWQGLDEHDEGTIEAIAALRAALDKAGAA